MPNLMQFAVITSRSVLVTEAGKALVELFSFNPAAYVIAVSNLLVVGSIGPGNPEPLVGSLTNEQLPTVVSTTPIQY
jgi:hypothetical protein